jgi:plasmid maintenance system antidote protein VapI
MHTTMDLLAKAMSPPYELTEADWCRELDISRTTLSVAKLRGKLSPVVAGNLARLIGEDVEHWIAVAALEAQPATYGRAKLQGMLSAAWRNS